METADLVAVVETESARFLEVLRDADLDEQVPSCPDWDGADLAWHLTEVQGFWGDIVDRLLEDPDDHDRPERPPDEDLLDMFAERSAALVSALRERDPDDTCWTWHPNGETVGWVARRQAHEALIHRVDAEQVAGERVTVVDPTLAADGADEIVRVMIDGLPPWATFTPDGDALTIVASDADGRWNLEFGRFTGRGPDSGRLYDLDAARIVAERPTDTTVEGRAWDLDLWLWGRGSDVPLAISGDVSLVDRLRELAVEATQ